MVIEESCMLDRFKCNNFHRAAAQSNRNKYGQIRRVIMFDKSNSFNNNLPFSRTIFFKDKKYGDEPSMKNNFNRDLPEMLYNLLKLEGSNFTLSQTHTLVQGLLPEGKNLIEFTEALNLLKALRYLRSNYKNMDVFNSETWCTFNTLIGRDIIPGFGFFRSGEVFIEGSTFRPPKSEDLYSLFDNEVSTLKQGSVFDTAVNLFIWGSRNQFFNDGNKRTSRLISCAYLMQNNLGYIDISEGCTVDFCDLLVEFYETKNADKLITFLHEKCYKHQESNCKEIAESNNQQVGYIVSYIECNEKKEKKFDTEEQLHEWRDIVLGKVKVTGFKRG